MKSILDQQVARYLRWLAATVAFFLAAPFRSPVPAQSNNVSDIDGIRFTLAEGLRIQKVAAEPLVKWPIVVDWDPQGRLVVAESGGVARPIETHNQQQLHRIVRLVDDDGDGVFDRRIVAADKLGFPEGVLCLGNDILVAAPPVIWKLTDSDQDGVCESRSVWFDGKTITGCANDLHGPYLGRDGWIYWCKGAFAEQTHTLADNRVLKTSAAHVFRRKLSGGPLEPLISGGMDNPVEVAFIPEGEKFFTSTFLQHPSGGLRDGIAHAVYGGLFGKKHSVVDDQIHTGPLMPIMTHLGPAAPSGLICVHSSGIVGSVADRPQRTLVAALFNLHRLTAHQLVPSGATFQTIDRDLVVADRVDFHPTDVIEDADGSLLLVDTGGWYDLCCPTSRIDQKTASGGIYRITGSSASSQRVERKLMDWSNITAGRAVDLLFDPRPWIRRSAGTRLQQLGDASVRPLQLMVENTGRPTDDRLTALWALCRVGTRSCLEVLANQLSASDTSILQAACHAVSVHRVATANDSLHALLEHPDAQIRRSAAEALGRVGSDETAVRLLRAIDDASDRHLEHAYLYALIELTRSSSALDLAQLAESEPQLRAALLVHDQLGRANQLDRLQVFAALKSQDPDLRTTAADVIAGQPQWAVESTEQLEELCSKLDDKPAADTVAQIMSGWRNQPPMQKLIADRIRTAPNSGQVQQRFFAQRLDHFCPQQLPSSWTAPIANWLSDAAAPIRLELAKSIGNVTVRSDDAPIIRSTLVTLAEQGDSVDERLALLAAIPSGQPLNSPQLEREVLEAFLSDDPSRSSLAGRALTRILIERQTGAKLVESLDQITPQSLMTAVESVHRIGDTEIQQTMLVRLRDIPSARTLPQSFLVNLYKKSPEALRKLAAESAHALIQPPADVRAAVDSLLKRLGPGDPLTGLQVFRSSKAACSACHRMGYIGADTGPDLTRIGRSRTPAALLEAVLFPSARQEQSYQSSQVMTVDGQSYNGLIKSRSGDSIELQLNAQRTIRLASDDIELIRPSDVSVMPAGLTELLSEDEIADLMALLRSAQ